MDRCQFLFCPLSEFAAALRPVQNVPQLEKGFGRCFEAPIEKQAWDAALRLHSGGQIAVGRGDRADVKDEIRRQRHDRFQIGRSAATGEAPNRGQACIDLREEGHFFGSGAACPSQKGLGRYGKNEEGSRRAGCEDTLDPVRKFNFSPARVLDHARFQLRRGRDEQKEEEKREKNGAHSGCSCLKRRCHRLYRRFPADLLYPPGSTYQREQAKRGRRFGGPRRGKLLSDDYVACLDDGGRFVPCLEAEFVDRLIGN